jgi:N-methylhydantoinase A/acetophenone carboxylase
MIRHDATANIDVDIGGTFTDALVSWRGKTVAVKTPTTGYNLAVGFMRALQEAAEDLGTDVKSLLMETEMIRYSTTVAMNKLLERKGPRLGLLTTRGFEDTILVGKGAQWADGLPVRERRNVARAVRPEPLISRDMIEGVKERIDSKGAIVAPLDEENVQHKVLNLVDRGAQGIVVALLWSYLNPGHERRIREIIRELFPDCYLGSMPVFLSSEVLPKRFEYTRTMTTVLNAYLHQSLWEETLGISEEARTHGYGRSLYLVHNSGGMATAFKTSAVQTYNGGPVAGCLGASFLAGQMGFETVVVADMGGTSFDVSMVEQGRPGSHLAQPLIDRWQVGMAMVETKSIGAGGGSIAWIDESAGRRLEVGPQSAGSIPGPAAYDQGGSEATVTDADFVLGYLNPDYFHGGRIPINLKRARSVIQERIAGPLGLSVEEAAVLIRKVLDARMGSTLFKETALRGYDTRQLTLFACGGAGPAHCCGFGAEARLSHIITFPFSPVFCAFGSSTMDIRHVYEHSCRIQLLEAGGKQWLKDYPSFNRMVERLRELAQRDIRGEGLPVDRILYELELDIKFGGQLNIKRTASPRLVLQSDDDVKALYEKFVSAYSRAYSPISVFPAGGVEIHNFILHSIVPRPKPQLPRYRLHGQTPSMAAVKKPRPVYWPEIGDFRPTPIYEEGTLEPGNVIAGPAIIEAPDTTTVVPHGWNYAMNELRAGIIKKE